MEKEKIRYIFVDTIERQNKDKTKIYTYACVCLLTKSNCDLMQVYVTDEQADKLIDLENRDISEYISVEYNSYSKAFTPKINL